MRSNTENLQPLRHIEQTAMLVFWIAYLLTASVSQSESAVLEAIETFDPDCDDEEALLQSVIRAAIQHPSSQSQPTRPLGPPEIRAVLQLSERLRQCFVLRILVRLPGPECARLLNLNAGTVDDYTCDALHKLAGLVPENHNRMTG